MGSDQKKRASIWLLFLPAAFFLVKDIIATFVVLSYPAISEEAVMHYSYALLPGTLFVVTGYAPLVNLVFGAITGIILYVFLTLRKRAKVR